MRISKQKEKTLRREFSRLKKFVKSNDKRNMLFLKKYCSSLLSALHGRWEIDNEQVLEDVRVETISEILHGLRNGL